MRKKRLFDTKTSCIQICNYDRVKGHAQKHLPRPLKHSQNVTVGFGKFFCFFLNDVRRRKRRRKPFCNVVAPNFSIQQVGKKYDDSGALFGFLKLRILSERE